MAAHTRPLPRGKVDADWIWTRSEEVRNQGRKKIVSGATAVVISLLSRAWIINPTWDLEAWLEHAFHVDKFNTPQRCTTNNTRGLLPMVSFPPSILESPSFPNPKEAHTSPSWARCKTRRSTLPSPKSPPLGPATRTSRLMAHRLRRRASWPSCAASRPPSIASSASSRTASNADALRTATLPMPIGPTRLSCSSCG